MSRSRILSSLAATALGVVALGACSTDALAERAAEFGLEQAIEGDQDIDFNFDDGNGGFSISTDEGDFAINLDGENGAVVFDSDDGSGVINFDEDGIVFDTDAGDGEISVTEDGIVFDTDEGDGEISFDDDGFVIETDEGSMSFLGGADVPEQWPAAVGVPTSMVVEQSAFNVFDLGQESLNMNGVFQHDPNEDFVATVQNRLAATGWNRTTDDSDDFAHFSEWQSGNTTVTLYSDGSGFSTVGVTATS